MEIIDTLNRAFIMFFLGIPVIMTTLMGFLSISLLNLGVIILFLGQLLIVPIAVIILHMVTWILPGTHVANSDIAMLIPSSYESIVTGGKINVAPSYWIAHVVFLCSYIFSNALKVYNMDPVKTNTAWRIMNRKARSKMIMILTAVILTLLILIRLYTTQAETVFGTIIGLAAFIPLGYGWYEVAIKSGAQNGDIFGIVQQMIPSIEDDTQASLCIKAK